MKLRFALAVFGLATTSVASAQKVSVGPNVNTPTTRESLSFNTQPLYQSLLIPQNPFGSRSFTYLKLKFWFEGNIYGNQYYHTGLSFTPDPYSPQDAIAVRLLDQRVNGWMQWIIRNPAPWVAGDMWWLYFSSDYSPAWFDACDVGSTNPICMNPLQTANTQVTNADTYAQGGFYYCDPPPFGDPECALLGDMLFEAQFTVTPEPSTWVLMASGLLGIGVVAARKRKKLQQ